MRLASNRRATRLFMIAVSAMIFCSTAFAQQKSTPKELFFDSDGNQVTNNEFVDIRMANSHYPDKTIVKTLEDGTVEFRLQKIPQEGAPAPQFTVKTLDGKTLTSTDLKGKVVVLSFWFIGCPACMEMEPHLNAFKAKFDGRSDVVFLAMTADPASSVKK